MVLLMTWLERLRINMKEEIIWWHPIRWICTFQPSPLLDGRLGAAVAETEMWVGQLAARDIFQGGSDLIWSSVSRNWFSALWSCWPRVSSDLESHPADIWFQVIWSEKTHMSNETELTLRSCALSGKHGDLRSAGCSYKHGTIPLFIFLSTNHYDVQVSQISGCPDVVAAYLVPSRSWSLSPLNCSWMWISHCWEGLPWILPMTLKWLNVTYINLLCSFSIP